MHQAIVAVKTDGARARVLVSSHCPRSKKVTGGKDSLWGDDCFDGIGGVETFLPMNGAVGESQWKIAHLGTTIIVGGRPFTMERDSDREWGNRDRVSKEGNVTGEADVGACIHK